MYPDVKIEWIFHHNPDLILYGEDGSQEKSIDLANYNYEQLHELFKTHFRTKVQQLTLRALRLTRASHLPRTCLTRASHVPHACLMARKPRLSGSASPGAGDGRRSSPLCREWQHVLA